MTDEPMPEDTAEPKPSKGKGIGKGVLVTIGAVVGAVVIGTIVGTIIAGSGLGLAYSPLLASALLVGAGIYWRKIPGFLLGMALTIVVGIVIGTGCTAALLSPGSIG